MTETKDFGAWIGIKKNVHYSRRIPAVKEGEIWWCAVGENVGVEINGKSRTFARSVLIYKKLSRFGFMGIPLTSQPHTGNWYANFWFQGRNQVAVLSQARVISVSRLYSKMGRIDESDMLKVKTGFRQLFC